MTKVEWKAFYRQMRIIRRESNKACIDAINYGIGYTIIDLVGIRHIPVEEILNVYK